MLMYGIAGRGEVSTGSWARDEGVQRNDWSATRICRGPLTRTENVEATHRQDVLVNSSFKFPPFVTHGISIFGIDFSRFTELAARCPVNPMESEEDAVEID